MARPWKSTLKYFHCQNQERVHDDNDSRPLQIDACAARRHDALGACFVTSAALATVLIVSDAKPDHCAESHVLREAGFHVLEAKTAQQALDRLEREHPPLVLIDGRLPDVMGAPLTELIKRRWPDTKIMQLSATHAAGDPAARGLEPDAKLIQPVDPEVLVTSVRVLARLHVAEEATRLLNDSLEERMRSASVEQRAANIELLQQMAQRERAEEGLMHAQKLETLGKLTGVIAHDFNNLLAGMSGYLQLIDRLAQDEKTRSMATRALGLVKRGSKLTDRLVNLGCTRALRVEAVDAKAVVEGMKEWLAQFVGSAFFVTTSVSDDDLFAITDESQLELAILNLAFNSRDAMPRGGPIEIRVERRAAGPLTDSPPELGAGDYVLVSVRDEGTGMSKEAAMKAFDPFRGSKGPALVAGLGLAQVCHLAEHSSGTARLLGQPGNGTVAELWLKAGHSTPVIAATPQTQAVSPAGGS